MGRLYFVGLGLYSEDSLTVQGLDILKKCKTIYAEFYTSYLSGLNLKRLESLIDNKIIVLDRVDVEEQADIILQSAHRHDTAFVTGGDPLVATTHSDLRLRAEKSGIKTVVIHGTSIYSAVAITGLQIYRFGRTVSIPFPEKNYFPLSPYNYIKSNLEENLHTLLLLDIKADSGRYMTCRDAVDILEKMEEKCGAGIINSDTLLIGLARAGSLDPVIVRAKVYEIKNYNLGKPPHVLIVPAELHYMEEEYLKRFAMP